MRKANVPSSVEIESAFSSLILSASGWRKVFAVSGDEEDASQEIGDANGILSAQMANVFADYLLSRPGTSAKKELVLGRDSRPTGESIAAIMCRVFLARGFSVRFPGITAAPEIMSYARDIGAFAYISASHNPIGHNGVKFGLGDGGVLDGTEAGKLITAFKAACAAPDAAEKALKLLASCDPGHCEAVLAAGAGEKKKALAAYEIFTREVISGESAKPDRDAFFSGLSLAVKKLADGGTPVSLVADFNGSARACSIDRAFFASCGLSLFGLSEQAGHITHRIVPEGDSLLFCANEIERLHRDGKTAEERGAVLAYMPDCDGDRGNIVVWNDRKKKAEPLDAQEVFALSVVAELAHLAYMGNIRCERGKPAEPPVAVAINDPTSLRIEAIAAAFGAEVARAEVGEANVVNLARKLRSEGSIVRILGEGSNGGNITHPAAVRDPLNTVFALLKLLILRDTDDKTGLFHLWCTLSGQEALYRPDFNLTDILATLPSFVTTSVYEKDAMLKIRTMDHAKLKRSFQTVFLREWETKKAELEQNYGFKSWIAISNKGIVQTEGLADFGLSGKGGLKIQFIDAEGRASAYIWMRGSGTEPVFRILADARGSDISVERMLLAWLAEMVLEADLKI